MHETAFSSGAFTWLRVACRGVRGEGRLLPRLVFELETRTPRERMEVHLQHLEARLVIGSEVAATGAVSGVVVGPGGRIFSLEMPVSLAAIEAAQTGVLNEGVPLRLEFRGVLLGRDDNTDGPSYLTGPTPGQWAVESVGTDRTVHLDVQVPRSDWFSKVREPLGTIRYLHLEIPVPCPGAPLEDAAHLLRRAEQALTLGDEPGVFLHCRGAIDALPGMPKSVFAALRDADEAKTLDDLLKSTGQYLHRGRHVVRDGEQQGSFPVTGQDARFALNLTKVVVAHVGAVLARG